MTNIAYVLASVAVCVAITVGIRALPFPVARTLRRHPIADDLSRRMPAGAVMILAVYCLAGIKDTTTTHGVAEIAGVGAVVLLHLWKRNMLLSIVGGTVICVTLANLL
jgi:branched-subunit amino acid transport protein AzlD